MFCFLLCASLIILASHSSFVVPQFHGGLISKGSELLIEVAEILWKNVQVSLRETLNSCCHFSCCWLNSLFLAWWKSDNFGWKCHGCNDNWWDWWNSATIWKEVLSYIFFCYISFWDIYIPSLELYLCRCGRCKLENVKVINRGIDWTSQDNIYWKHDVRRFETVKIVLHGNAEFEAVDITLQVYLHFTSVDIVFCIWRVIADRTLSFQHFKSMSYNVEIYLGYNLIIWRLPLYPY